MLKQSRLDRFFDVPQRLPSAGLSFLDLPSSIRSRIYAYSNLVREYPIHVNIERSEDGTGGVSKKTIYCTTHICVRRGSCFCLPPPLSHSLLLVSRAVYQEVCAILYSQNCFHISRYKDSSLEFLANLSPKALASLTALTVRLNENGPCSRSSKRFSHGSQCIPRCESCSCAELNDLGKLSRHERSIIQKWKTICKQLALHVQASRLSLCLICDTDGYETAQEILKPMMDLPLLKTCSIRLAMRPNRELQILAETTTLRLTGRSTVDPSVSRSPTLPGEILTQILLDTDLVAPHDLEWVPESGYKCNSMHSGMVWSEPEPSWTNLNPCSMCRPVRQSCCRPLTQAAFASQCQCWRFPSALFLVNQKIRKEAIRIFYSRNHFFILQRDSEARPWPMIWKCPPFLKLLPRDALKYLRSLQFVMLHYIDYLLTDTQPAKDWLACIDLLHREADLPQLTVTIDMSRSRREIDGYHLPIGTTLDYEAWSRDQRLLEPVERLHALKDLFVHLAHPAYSTDWIIDRERKERLLERQVMGEGYDSSIRGKFSNPDRWRQDY
ncbi:MAG: hypothetical protein Q9164_006268 [Protoblastenia rupestris]